MRQWLIHPDYLVGGVAITMGTLVVLAALVNHEWTFQLRKTQWVERRWGRAGARVVCGLIGLGLIGLGIVIAVGRS